MPSLDIKDIINLGNLKIL